MLATLWLSCRMRDPLASAPRLTADSGMADFMLGVEISVAGRARRDRLDDAARAQALAMAQSHGLPDFVARILACGVSAPQAEAFLLPELCDLLPEPFALGRHGGRGPGRADRRRKARRLWSRRPPIGSPDILGLAAARLKERFRRPASAPPASP